MDDIDAPAPDYQKGFNEGYLIAQHIPDLAEQLTRTENDSMHFKGIKQGIVQFDLEKSKENYPAWLKKDRLSSLDKDKEQPKDKEKDGFDKE